jgi:hypothetical protein
MDDAVSAARAQSQGGTANGEPGKFSLGFGGGEFTPAEMKRIMADEKLADPRRVKRYVH